MLLFQLQDSITTMDFLFHLHPLQRGRLPAVAMSFFQLGEAARGPLPRRRSSRPILFASVSWFRAFLLRLLPDLSTYESSLTRVHKQSPNKLDIFDSKGRPFQPSRDVTIVFLDHCFLGAELQLKIIGLSTHCCCSSGCTSI